MKATVFSLEVIHQSDVASLNAAGSPDVKAASQVLHSLTTPFSQGLLVAQDLIVLATVIL